MRYSNIQQNERSTTCGLNINNNIDSPAIKNDIPPAKIEDVNEIIKNNPKKTIGPDKIPPKIVRLSAKLLILIK